MAVLSGDIAYDAARLLDRADVKHGAIIAVDRDSILFLGHSYLGQRARTYTAWLDGTKVVLVEDGMAAIPPPDLHAPPKPLNYGLAGFGAPRPRPGP